MSKIEILDCTLRDGGYVNNWSFGTEMISKIAENISMAAVELIECGFLSQQKESSSEKSIFYTISEAEKYFERVKQNNLLLMINCGEYCIDEMEAYSGGKIKSIRIAFHKHQLDEAKTMCLKLQNKGYTVFFQPMVTMRYTDEELLKLIKWANESKPEAFYIVDSFGTMRKKDILRMFYLIDNNLCKTIKIGFHSHNNLQLSFSNAQELIALHSERKIIIDTAVFGMGRGAGNLCTELMLQYINENIENKYNILPILEIMDEHIMPIFKTHSWGYSVPYYIAAVNDCHPNYATYLTSMQTLFIKDINHIMRKIQPEKRYLFDKDYIDQLYFEYQKNLIDDTEAIEKIKTLCFNQNVLVLAPGKTLITHRKKILQYIKEKNPIIISINHISDFVSCDRVFISNLKRFRGIKDAVRQIGNKIICTSNIVCEEKVCVVNYSSYIEEEGAISDNSGIMMLNILKSAKVKKVALAGYDGFDDNCFNNYYDEKMIGSIDFEKMNDINRAIITYLKRNKDSLDVIFITPSLYEKYKG